MKILSIVLITFMGIGLLVGYYVQHQFAQTRPSVPMIKEGRLKPFQYHGKTVYLTSIEYWFAYLPMVGGIAAGIAGGGLWKKTSTKKNR